MKMMELAVAAVLVLAVGAEGAFAFQNGQIGMIYKSCGPCDHQIWQENQSQIYVRSCDVIGFGGKNGQDDLACDPDAPPACSDLQIKLLNRVSLGREACDQARAEYAAQSCGELGWPDCALFSLK